MLKNKDEYDPISFEIDKLIYTVYIPKQDPPMTMLLSVECNNGEMVKNYICPLSTDMAIVDKICSSLRKRDLYVAKALVWVTNQNNIHSGVFNLSYDLSSNCPLVECVLTEWVRK